MPMIEILYVKDVTLHKERKRAFAKKAERILQEELGTPPGRMRLFFSTRGPKTAG